MKTAIALLALAENIAIDNNIYKRTFRVDNIPETFMCTEDINQQKEQRTQHTQTKVC